MAAAAARCDCAHRRPRQATAWRSGLPEAAKRDYFAQAAQALPTRRIATAGDIADIVVTVAVNRNITGTIIEADGGARLVTID